MATKSIVPRWRNPEQCERLGLPTLMARYRFLSNSSWHTNLALAACEAVMAALPLTGRARRG